MARNKLKPFLQKLQAQYATKSEYSMLERIANLFTLKINEEKELYIPACFLTAVEPGLIAIPLK